MGPLLRRINYYYIDPHDGTAMDVAANLLLRGFYYGEKWGAYLLCMDGAGID